MKKLLILFTLIAVTITSCSKDAFDSQLEDSYRTFQKFKQSNGGNYSYTVTTSSWTGFGTETVIFVQNNIVTGRAHNSYRTDGATGTKIPQESWSEDKTTLNSHQSGAATLTLDEVYSRAKNVWMKVDKNSNKIIFETANDSMISQAGHVPNNCQDDCFTGISIKEIKPYITTAGK